MPSDLNLVPITGIWCVERRIVHYCDPMSRLALMLASYRMLEVMAETPETASLYKEKDRKRREFLLRRNRNVLIRHYLQLMHWIKQHKMFHLILQSRVQFISKPLFYDSVLLGQFGEKFLNQLHWLFSVSDKDNFNYLTVEFVLRDFFNEDKYALHTSVALYERCKSQHSYSGDSFPSCIDFDQLNKALFLLDRMEPSSDFNRTFIYSHRYSHLTFLGLNLANELLKRTMDKNYDDPRHKIRSRGLLSAKVVVSALVIASLTFFNVRFYTFIIPALQSIIGPILSTLALSIPFPLFIALICIASIIFPKSTMALLVLKFGFGFPIFGILLSVVNLLFLAAVFFIKNAILSLLIGQAVDVRFLEVSMAYEIIFFLGSTLLLATYPTFPILFAALVGWEGLVSCQNFLPYTRLGRHGAEHPLLDTCLGKLFHSNMGLILSCIIEMLVDFVLTPVLLLAIIIGAKSTQKNILSRYRELYAVLNQQSIMLPDHTSELLFQKPLMQGLMTNVEIIVNAEQYLNRAMTPREQVECLLKQYLHQGSVVSFFFKKTKPQANFVRQLLALLETKADFTIADIDFELDQQESLDPELAGIAEYVQYVLVPMEEKADYDRDPSFENLKRKLPILIGYEVAENPSATEPLAIQSSTEPQA